MAEMNYEQAGVRYDALDAFKRLCQREAATTTSALAHHHLREPANVRGDSAYLLETEHDYLAHVEEGLGTKNLIADAMRKLTGENFYASIGIDTVATIVNDLITCGALPISVAMHAAVGDSAWFDDTDRAAALAKGFAEGCRRAGAAWGGGETPALKGIVQRDAIVLAGSAIGRITPKSNRIEGNVQPGDAIILLASTGVQTNGLTLCRAIAEKLPDGYLSRLPGGRSFGAALLDASAIYVDFLAACQRENLRPHYVAHLTGHGWRKLMRLDLPLVYRMTDIGTPPAIFAFLAESGPVSIREMYATFNMGAGFAVYAPADRANVYLRIAKETNHHAWIAGAVVKEGVRKAVEIVPLNMTFEADTLNVRNS